MNEDKFLTASIEDRAEQCEERYMVTNTAFFDLRQRSIAEAFVKKTGAKNAVFWGGCAEAERCCLIFFPDYIEPDLESKNIFAACPEENPLAVIRVSYSSGSRELSHRDYLGSLMGLGIKREFVGDIITYSKGADIIILKEIRDFLVMNYDKAGNTSLETEEIAFDELRNPMQNVKEKSDTVASLRLDNVISAIYGLPRGAAAEAIKGGLIFVNNLQIEKPDRLVKEGDVLVYRGKGKSVLSKIGGKSRKDRIYINFIIYI